MNPRLKRPESEIQSAQQGQDDEYDSEYGRINIEVSGKAAAHSGQFSVDGVAVESAARFSVISGRVP